jgi:hypothetical protein
MQRCPKCGHRPSAADASVPEGVCPACGIAWAKWLARQQSSPTIREPATREDDTRTFLARLQAQLLEPPDGDPAGWKWRGVVLAALGAWTLWFALHGIDWEIIGGSFLHRANLAFHEFGHLFFRPLGEFMAILGGSLFQLLLPLALAGYFVVQQRDNIGAAVALWWCGQNFVDLAPYIRDAEYRVLPLVGGGGEESHDWGNLLTRMDAVESCYALARGSFVLGLLVMLLALAWAGVLLWRWRAGDAS